MLHHCKAVRRGVQFAYLIGDMPFLSYQVDRSEAVRNAGRFLKEGGAVRLGYSGKNGHPYTSIGRLLIERGAIAPDAMSMAAVKAWLRADETRGRALMEENGSYVFFRELDAEEGRDGPRGAQGVAHAGRNRRRYRISRLGCRFVTAASDRRTTVPPPDDRAGRARRSGRATTFQDGEDAGAIAGSTA
jgi:hypothetical protein